MRKVVKAVLLLTLTAGLGEVAFLGVRATPQWQRHLAREAYWRSACHGFDVPYMSFEPGTYCPESDVQSRCLFDSPESRAAAKRGIDVASLRAMLPPR